jgi:hypothetical protein
MKRHLTIPISSSKANHVPVLHPSNLHLGTPYLTLLPYTSLGTYPPARAKLRDHLTKYCTYYLLVHQHMRQNTQPRGQPRPSRPSAMCHPQPHSPRTTRIPRVRQRASHWPLPRHVWWATGRGEPGGQLGGFCGFCGFWEFLTLRIRCGGEHVTRLLSLLTTLSRAYVQCSQ